METKNQAILRIIVFYLFFLNNLSGSQEAVVYGKLSYFLKNKFVCSGKTDLREFLEN